MNSQDHIKIGLERISRLDYYGAINAFTASIKIDPNNPIPYNYRGYCKNKIGSISYAIQDLNKAIEIDSEYGAAYRNRSYSKIQVGYSQSAIDDCNKSLKINSNCYVSYYLRGVAKTQLKLFIAAKLDFDKSINKNKQYANAYNDRGLVFKELFDLDKKEIRYLNEALNDWKKSIEINPNFFKPYKNLADRKKEKSELKEALEIYNIFLNIAKKENVDIKQALFHRAEIKNDMANYEGAIDDLKKAIDIDPNNAIFYIKRGMMKNRIRGFISKSDENYSSTMADFQKGKKTRPADPEIHTEIGITERLKGNSKEAIDNFEKAIEKDWRYLDAYIQLGEAKENIKDMKGAIAAYTEGIRVEELLLKNPQWISSEYSRISQLKNAYKKRGDVLNKIGELQKANDDWEKASNIDARVVKETLEENDKTC